MGSEWRGKIEGLLRDEMRYCFNGDMVSLNEDEFSGSSEEGALGGFLHHVLSMVQDMRREMFMHGYAQGALDAIIDIKSMYPNGKDVEMSREINQITAERRFMEVDK